jgi:acetolactate synthase regulatory subunit
MAVAVSAGTTKGASVTNIQRLELKVVDDPSVLLRIVSTCHQRGCRIVSLQYDRAVDAGLVLLRVDADSQHTPRLELWLSKLIHVLAVHSAAATDEAVSLAAGRVLPAV